MEAANYRGYIGLNKDSTPTSRESNGKEHSKSTETRMIRIGRVPQSACVVFGGLGRLWLSRHFTLSPAVGLPAKARQYYLQFIFIQVEIIMGAQKLVKSMLARSKARTVDCDLRGFFISQHGKASTVDKFFWILRRMGLRVKKQLLCVPALYTDPAANSDIPSSKMLCNGCRDVEWRGLCKLCQNPSVQAYLL